MTDGNVFIRTKDQAAIAAQRSAPSGQGAKIFSRAMTSGGSGSGLKTWEAIRFTLEERSTIYINATVSLTNSRRWYWTQLAIPIEVPEGEGENGQWVTEPHPGGFLFNTIRASQNRDQFDAVTLDAGSYVLYIRVSTTSFEGSLYSAQIVVGANNETTTMVYQELEV